MNILLTGATGFVGKHLYSRLNQQGHSVIIAKRSKSSKKVDIVKLLETNKNSPLVFGNLGDITASIMEERGVEAIVHCAGLAHNPAASAEQFREINTKLTLKLAESAAEAGVKRFIFFSSIGVNGASSFTPFKADDKAIPYDDYTESKYNAERGLKALSEITNMEVVIIRPPLIYGNNAPGNFDKFVKLAKLPLPKPLGAISNTRSFVSIDNLTHFTHCCLTHPSAANEVFLVSDGQDLSTTQFLKKISRVLGKRPWLIPVPASVLKALARLLGKQSTIDKIAMNLQVDIQKNKTLLGWEPLVSVDEALERALSKKSN